MNVFLDTNVILEYFAAREKYAVARRLFNHLHSNGDCLFMSVGSFYTIVFLVDKVLRKETSLRGDSRRGVLRDIMSRILCVMEVAQHDKESLLNGLINIRFDDIEDSCQYELAKKSSCELLITFNTSDYPTDNSLSVTVLSPEEYLESKL